MSLIETYQSCKSLFAEKLITKGVNADGSDGLTTLINKIDGIQHFGNGLFVWADKPILQDSETSNLYGLVLENGVPVVGEQVNFYDSALFGFDGLVFEDSFGRTALSYTQTPEKLTVTSTGSQGMTALTGMKFNGDYTIEFKCKGDSVSDGMGFSIQSVNATSIEQYILAVNYEMHHIQFGYSDNSSSSTPLELRTTADSNEHTVKFDITGNTAKLYFDGVLKWDISDLTWLHDELQLTVHSWGSLTLEIYDFKLTGECLGYSNTDSKGLATVGYSGKGSGVLNIKAECMFVSKTFSLYDTLFYDSGVTGTANTDWFKSNNEVVSTVTNNGTLIVNNSSSGQFYLANKPNTPSGSYTNVKEFPIPFSMEFYIVEYTGTVSYHVYDGTTNAQHTLNGSNIGNGVTVRIEHDGEKQRVFVDGTSVGVFNHSLSGDCRVGFLLNSNSSILYKDFKIYPI